MEVPNCSNKGVDKSTCKTSTKKKKISIPFPKESLKETLKSLTSHYDTLGGTYYQNPVNTSLNREESSGLIAKNVESLIKRFRPESSRTRSQNNVEKKAQSQHFSSIDTSQVQSSLVCVNFPLITKFSAAKRYKKAKQEEKKLSLSHKLTTDRRKPPQLNKREKDMYDLYRAKREKFIKIKENKYQISYSDNEQVKKQSFQAVRLKNPITLTKSSHEIIDYGSSSFTAYNFRKNQLG